MYPTKCYTNSKVCAPSEKTNSEQERLQAFRKSLSTTCQIPQFNRQLIPTTGTSNSKGSQTPIVGISNSKGSQTPIRPVARQNKIPTNGGSQSRPARNCWTLSAKSNKVKMVIISTDSIMAFEKTLDNSKAWLSKRVALNAIDTQIIDLHHVEWEHQERGHPYITYAKNGRFWPLPVALRTFSYPPYAYVRTSLPPPDIQPRVYTM